MAKVKKELLDQSEGRLTRQVTINADLADMLSDLVRAGEAKSIAILVDPILRGPIESLHKSKGKKAEQLRKLTEELRRSRRESSLAE